MAHAFSSNHLLGIRGLSREDIALILDTAEQYVLKNREKNKKTDLLKGRTLMNLFFENSTRTRTSFELAGKRLGADVINMSASTSSIKKGESLIDTAMTLNAMHPDFLVIRHAESGSVPMLAKRIRNCAIINAGDGCHEHPTQALLDALSIRRKVGRLKGLTVAICGDIAHSRVARSNILLLNTMGATVRLVAPPTLMPRFAETLGAEVHYKLENGIRNADIIMMLRLQNERMEGNYVPSVAEYFQLYGLNSDKLKHAAPDAYVMHPGPINRGVEISGELADDIRRSMILDQVEMGVAVRQAVLKVLSDKNG